MTPREQGWGTERALRLLLRLYPEDFRDEMGEEWLGAYRARAAKASAGDGGPGPRFWLRAVADSLRNGLGERLNPAVWWRRRGNWGRDTQRAARGLIRAPAFTLATVGTLTVGLGAFAVVWSAVDNVLLEPPPYERPEDLYFVWRDYRAFFDLDRGSLSGPDVAALDTAGGVIVGAAAIDVDPVPVELRPGGQAQELKAMRVGAGLLELLGVSPMIGRGFVPEDEGEASNRVVVLGHALWRSQLREDAGVIGSQIRLGNQPFTIIGVMPPGFAFVQPGTGSAQTVDLYTTFPFSLSDQDPGGGSYSGLIRAAAGTPREAVVGAVSAVGARLDEQYFDSGGMKYYPVSLAEDLVKPVRPALVVLGTAGGFLVLVLMVNLATLLLGRAAQREQELAVSRALGADRWTLARAILLEGAILGVLGAAGGLLVAVQGAQALVRIAPADLPRRTEIAVDGSVVAVVVGAGLLLGLLAGLLPAVWSARAKLSDVLRQAAVRGGGGTGRIRRGMVVVQVALSLVLLTAGGILVRSFEALLRTDPGFEATGALTFRILVAEGDAYPDAEAATALHDRILAGLSAIPGVEAAGALSVLPLTADADQRDVAFPGAPGNTGEEEHDQPLADVIAATEGAIEALGARIIQGRGFSPPGAEPANEVLIDHTFAREFYSGRSAIGAPMLFAGDTMRIVGVVHQPRIYDVHEDSRGQVWPRSREYTYLSLLYVVRSERPPMSLVNDVRAVVRDTDPTLPVSQIRPIEDLVASSLSRQRLSATLIAAFALGALVLAAMGLFGIVSAAVTRRRTELGIRMALGADAGRVLRMVLADGLRLVFFGLVLGIPGVWMAGRVLDSVVVGISTFDPVTLVAVAAGLALVTALACWIPARRVTVIDPARSLRAE